MTGPYVSILPHGTSTRYRHVLRDHTRSSALRRPSASFFFLRLSFLSSSPNAPIMIQPSFRLALRPQITRLSHRQFLASSARLLQRQHASQSAPPNPALAPAAPAALPTPFQRVSAPLKRALQAYGTSQLCNPWITQISTSVVINCLGDVNAQFMFSEAGVDFDVVRTLRMMLSGAILAIPGNEWYTRISFAFRSYSRPVAVGLRVTLSQVVFSPLILLGFFIVQGVLLGMGVKEIRDKIENTMPTAFIDSLKLWPAVSLVSFWLIPMEFRALLGGVASLGWNTWLSYLNSRPADEMDGNAAEVVTLPMPVVVADISTPVGAAV